MGKRNEIQEQLIEAIKQNDLMKVSRLFEDELPKINWDQLCDESLTIAHENNYPTLLKFLQDQFTSYPPGRPPAPQVDEEMMQSFIDQKMKELGEAEEKERDDAKSKKVIHIEDDCTLWNLYRAMEFFSDKRATGYVIPTYEKAMEKMDFKDDEEIEKTFEYIIDNYKSMPMPCEIREALEKVRESTKEVEAFLKMMVDDKEIEKDIKIIQEDMEKRIIEIEG